MQKPAVPSRTRRPWFLRLLQRIFIIGLLSLVAIQFIPYGREHPNPPVQTEPAWSNAETQVLFVRACADCHSNQTAWPWYSFVAPGSWLVTRDVLTGRAAFNTSTVDGMEEGEDAAKRVEEGDMPPLQYLLAHPEARLSAAERQALISGLSATFDSDRDDDRRDEDREEDREEDHNNDDD